MRKLKLNTLSILKPLFLGISIVFITSCKKESTISPEEFQANDSTLSANLLAATAVTSSTGYNIENALPKGYVKTGKVDYTSYIQSAVNKYSVVTFPAFPIMVNDKGITIGSNKTLNFLKGSELRLKGTKASNYHILKVYKASNVVINNPVIIGDRNSHLTTTGEYGSGISVFSSSNVTINNATVKECWGDGIYLGHVSGSSVNRNITIKSPYLLKNRRDGLTVIAANGLLVENLYAGYTDGTSPMCGINFEPNTKEDELKNIKIVNPRTEYSGGNGIQIGTRNLLLASSKTIDITITNHNDYKSKAYALKVSSLRKSGNGTVSGTVRIEKPTWRNTLSGKPFLLYMDQKNVKTIVTSPTVVNSSSSILNLSSTLSLLNKSVSMGSLSIL
jgi:parallel beta-helix repeat protein